MKHQDNRRARAWDPLWSAHYLTFSCFQRKPFFKNLMFVEWFLTAVTKAPFRLWAYVVMPEHVHLVVLPSQDVTVSKVLWHLKRPLSRQVVGWAEGHDPAFLLQMRRPGGGSKNGHHFWLPGRGYDRVLRSVADVHEKIRYVHANPVRRGLVGLPEDWPHSSAKAWATGKDDPIPLDRDSLPPLTDP